MAGHGAVGAIRVPVPMHHTLTFSSILDDDELSALSISALCFWSLSRCAGMLKIAACAEHELSPLDTFVYQARQVSSFIYAYPPIRAPFRWDVTSK